MSLQQPNSLDDITSSIKDGNPVMVVHKLTGGFVRRWGDAQVVHDKVASVNDGTHHFRIHLAARHRGNNLYTFESLRVDGEGKRNDPEPVVMSANPENVADGIQWPAARSLEQDPQSKEAQAQHWYIVPQGDGCYAIVSYLNPAYSLGLINKSAVLNACGRPNELVYGVVPVICCWQIVAPNPDKECIESAKTPEV